jgi:hypothetical protein
MKFTHTLVVGCGGTGGYLIPPLAKLLTYHPNAEGHITLCDGDTFEPHNAERQLMLGQALNANKAEHMASILELQDAPQGPDLHIDVIPEFLAPDNLAGWLMGTEVPLIIAAVDNDATRKMICQGLEEASSYIDSFMFITPGNDAGDAEHSAAIKGQVLWWGKAEGEAFGVNPAIVYPNIENPSDPPPTHGECSAHAPSQPQLIAANMLAAANTLAAIQMFLDRNFDPTTHAIFFDSGVSKLI